MPEISLVGEAFISGWGWEIAIDLFIGGLVAGLMIFSGIIRMTRTNQFPRSLFLADLTSFPLLAIGMIFLFLDLSNKLNVWRLYTTFQVTSPMSWGAWILLFSMIILVIRFVSCVAKTKPSTFLGMKLFSNSTEVQKTQAVSSPKSSAISTLIERVWSLLDKFSRWIKRFDYLLAILSIPLGIGIGLYTGALLSSLPSHPLWNSAFLAPLFLVSGLVSGGAFLILWLPEDERKRLVPYSIALSITELLLVIAFAVHISLGTQPMQRSVPLLLSGTYGWFFWGLVILFGALVPVILEQMDMVRNRVPTLQRRLPAFLKLVGRFTLRFVIVFAGLLSFI